MRKLLFFIPLILSASIAHGASDPMLENLINTVGYEPSMIEAAGKSAVAVQNPCPSAYHELTPNPVVIQKMTLNKEGKLVAGQWKQTVLQDGCGATRKLNVWASVDPQKHRLRLQPVLPGVTLADVTLQQDAVKYAVAALSAKTKICETGYVYDTAFASFTAAAKPGSKGPPWDEIWTLVYCDIKGEVTMHFTPESNGTTTINATAAETKIIKLLEQ